MAILSLLRQRIRLYLEGRRYFSSLLNPDPKRALTCREKTDALISRMKVETNPKKFIPLCRVAELNPHIRIDRDAFRLFVNRLVELRYRAGIRKFIEDLKEKRQDLRPDLKTEYFHRFAMVLYSKAGMFDDCIRTFEEMDKHCIPRSTKTLTTLLRCFNDAKEYGEIGGIIKEFPTQYGVRPDEWTYHEVIRGFCLSGSSASVFSILEEMGWKKLRPLKKSFQFLLAGLFNEGKLSDVKGVLKLLFKHHFPKTFKTFNTSIVILCQDFSNPSQAKVLLDFMVSKGKKPDNMTYVYLTVGFIDAGNWVEAKEMRENMKKAGIKTEKRCSYVVKAWCRKWEVDTALEVCNEMVASDVKPNRGVMKFLVKRLKEKLKIEEACELQRKLFEKFPEEQWNEVEASPLEEHKMDGT